MGAGSKEERGAWRGVRKIGSMGRVNTLAKRKTGYGETRPSQIIIESINPHQKKWQGLKVLDKRED